MNNMMDISPMPGGYGDSSFMDIDTPIKQSISSLTTPTSKQFSFTPKTLAQSVYPSFDKPMQTPSKSPLKMASNNIQIHTDIVESELAQKGYSKKLSNSVLDELNSRAEQISSRLSLTPVRNSPSKSGRRYSAKHRSRFSKMDSITAHYAASRSKANQVTNHVPLKRIENEVENTGPDNSVQGKRNPLTILSSATKRRKTLVGSEEVQKKPIKPAELKENEEDEDKENKENQPFLDNLTKINQEKIPAKATIVLSPSKFNSSSARPLKDVTSSYPSMTRSSTLSSINTLSNNNKPTSRGLSHKSSIPTLPRIAAIKSLEKKGSMSSLTSKQENKIDSTTSIKTHILSRQTSTASLNTARQLKTKQSMPQMNTSNNRVLNSKPSLSSLPSIRSLCTKKSMSSLNETPSTPLPRSTSTKFSATKPLNPPKFTPALHHSPSLNKLNKDKPVWR